jgi:hypothetical protein
MILDEREIFRVQAFFQPHDYEQLPAKDESLEQHL